jgi:hypothetical protein
VLLVREAIVTAIGEIVHELDYLVGELEKLEAVDYQDSLPWRVAPRTRIGLRKNRCML